MVLIFFISPLRQREGRSQEAGWGRRSLHFLLLLFLLYASFFSARLLWCPLRSYGDYRRLAVVCIERRGRGEVGGLFFLVSFAPHSALANIRSPPTLCDPWNPHNSNDNNNNRNNKRKKCRPGRKTWRHRLRWWPFSGDQFVGSITVDRTIDVSWFFVFFFCGAVVCFWRLCLRVSVLTWATPSPTCDAHRPIRLPDWPDAASLSVVPVDHFIGTSRPPLHQSQPDLSTPHSSVNKSRLIPHLIRSISVSVRQCSQLSCELEPRVLKRCTLFSYVSKSAPCHRHSRVPLKMVLRWLSVAALLGLAGPVLTTPLSVITNSPHGQTDSSGVQSGQTGDAANLPPVLEWENLYDKEVGTWCAPDANEAQIVATPSSQPLPSTTVRSAADPLTPVTSSGSTHQTPPSEETLRLTRWADAALRVVRGHVSDDAQGDSAALPYHRPVPSAMNLYVAPPSPTGGKMFAVLPDGPLNRAGPRDAWLVLDPTPNAAFGHVVHLFAVDLNVTDTACISGGGYPLGWSPSRITPWIIGNSRK